MDTAHTVGSKYAGTKNLGAAEISKLIKEDIKAAIKAGELPTGIECSVRLRRSTTSSAIDIVVTAAPFVARFSDFLSDHDAERVTTMRRQSGIRQPWLTDEARAVEEKLESIHSAYNFDNSDLQSDYFHVRYYGGVSWRLNRD